MRERSTGSPTSPEPAGRKPSGPPFHLPRSTGRRRRAAPRPRRGAPRRPRAVLAFAAALVALIAHGATAADPEAGRRKAEPCRPCHGADGNAAAPGTPSLAGQPAFYTHWQLIKFQDGRRKDPRMSPFAQSLSTEDMADLAAYYQTQPPRPRGPATDPGRVAAGRRLADLHHCASCHRPGFTGQEQVPRLAGQDYDYLLKQLRGFKAKTASDLDGTMTIAAQPLRDEDILDLVGFIASLGAE